MDVKDNKILEQLLLNSRVALSTLSKKTGISREVANYRIKRLKKRVIREFYTIINYELIGFRRYGVVMQLKGISAEKEKGFIEYLKKHDYVTYLSPLIGKWNLAFDIIIKDETHLKEVLEEISNKIRPNLESYIITGHGLDMNTYPTKYVGKIVQSRKIRQRKLSYKIDSVDKQILRALAINARIEYQELSKRLGLAANTIKYRIKNMENVGIIQGYTIGVNHREMGYEFYDIQLKLNNTQDINLLAYIKNHLKTIFYYKYVGHENWDIDIGVIVKSSQEFRDFMIELKNNFGELIKIHDMYLILETSKDDYAPGGVFK